MLRKMLSHFSQRGPLSARVLFKPFYDRIMPSPGPIIENSHRGMTVRLGEARFERAECGAHGHGPRFTELRSVLRLCAQPRVHTRPDVGESEQTVTATVNFTAFNNYQ